MLKEVRRFEKQQAAVMLSFILLTIIMVVLAIVNDGTGDEGDSITHYLLARSSWTHHDLFLDHWGKPVFTIVFSPIAQLPFTGVKIFNAILFSTGILLTIKLALEMNIREWYLLPLLALFTPHYIQFSLSGLTEPMFNVWLLTGIFLFFKNKNWQASLWLSFLPFVRSEGLVILMVITAYLLFKRKYRSILLLPVGHIVFSLAGNLLLDKPFLWVFNEMTYAELRSNYGTGTWLHFFKKAPVVFGIHGLILIFFGLSYGVRIIMNYKHSKEEWFSEKVFLIFGCALGLFFFHVFAWGMGWFHSLGLTRVINGVMGPFLIISMFGFNQLIQWLPNVSKRVVLTLSILIIIITTLSGRLKYGFNYEQNMDLRSMQRVMIKTADVIRELYPDYPSRIICYEASYLAVELGLDFYDKVFRSIMRHPAYKSLPVGSLLVWDDWYAVTQGGTPLYSVMADPSFRKIAEFKDFDSWDIWDEPHYAVLFEKIN